MNLPHPTLSFAGQVVDGPLINLVPSPDDAPPPAVWPLLAGIGAAAAIGQLTLTRAFSLAEASAVLPLDFVRFGLITAAGILLFGETYDALTLAGGALILSSTIYLAWREAQLKKAG